MEVTVGAADLAGQAAARAVRARLVGRLLAAEPGPGEAALAAQVPSLAAAFADLAGLRADYARVLLGEVACHESVFTAPDAEVGRIDPALPALYERWDYRWEDRFRVPAADHLGQQLDFLGHLCEAERDGWSQDRPDRATEAVEAQRTLLAAHAGAWGPAAADALARAGEGTAYGVLGHAVAELLAAEAQRLRPAPEHPGMPPVTEGLALDTSARGGPARTARRLLAPARAGGYLTRGEIAAAARAVGAAWRPSDTRARLRHVVESALDGGRAEALAGALLPVVEGWVDRWARERDRQPGAARTFESWRLRAAATVAFLQAFASGEARGPATYVVTDAAGLAAALAELSAAGHVVTVESAPDEVRSAVDVVVRVDPDGAAGWGTGGPGAGSTARRP